MGVRLRDALGIQRGDVVAFVGAGGKTSALFRLASELSADGWRVLATTTTRLARSEVQRAPYATALTPALSPAIVREWLERYRFVFLYSSEDLERNKIAGLSPDFVAPLVDSVTSDVLLIEADGSRRLPFKAPYDHEPVIPNDATLVVPVAGADALGKPLDQQHVYNAARIQERYGFPDGAELIPPWMAVIIRDPELGLRGVPDGARVVPLLNKVPTEGALRRRARRVAELALRSPQIEAVALGEMQSAVEPVHEVQRRVAAVVVAAGLSSRMGHSKVLLPWDRHTVLEAVIAKLLAARLTEIVVVTGHRSRDVEMALQGWPVRTVHNPGYAAGDMLSSVQVGLSALDETIAASLIVLGDQPMLDNRVVGQVLTGYAEGRGTIVTPVYRGRRGHPVLFDRRYWPELLALTQGAPRDVVRRYESELALIPVSNDSILRDIDTPDQYRRERYFAGLPRLD